MFKSTIFISVFLAFTLSSCSQKSSVLKNFESQENPKSIQFTKKRDFKFNNEIKSSFFITYLNKIDKSFESESFDSFLVGFYRINKEEHNLIKNNYEVILNNKKPLEIAKIPTDSNIVKSISLKNNWANYYIIKFKGINSKKLKLTISHPKFEDIELNYDK